NGGAGHRTPPGEAGVRPPGTRLANKTSGRPRPARKALALWLMALLTAGAVPGCHGGVDHPPPDQPNDPEYCSKRPAIENNCMACSSQPGCGWCDVPQTGQASCQAGATHEAPATCQDGWAFSTE